jgi:hypothetical protein
MFLPYLNLSVTRERFHKDVLTKRHGLKINKLPKSKTVLIPIFA